VGGCCAIDVLLGCAGTFDTIGTVVRPAHTNGGSTLQTATLPDYSVVIPAWQAAAFIERSVHSALDQTVSTREVIVVDDGSTDDTASRLASIAASDARVITMSIENRGNAGARNVGIAIATSPWIAFLDADDYWYSDKSERQLAHLARHRNLVAVGGRLRYAGRSGPMRGITGIAAIGTYEAGEIRAGRLMPFAPSSMIVKRTTLDQIGGFDADLTPADDLDLVARLSAVGNIGVVEGEFGWYRLHMSAGSATGFRKHRQLSRFIAARIEARQLGGDLMWDEFISNDQLSRNESRHEFADEYFRRTAVHLAEGSRFRAAGAASLGIGLAPVRNARRLASKVRR
jgi:glycosyltransferase involved in cell wall biosynthesis